MQEKSINSAVRRTWHSVPRPSAQIRGLLIHDALAFLALLAVLIALFGVTLVLFRSFQTQRAQLATHWAEQGKAALAAGHADEAVRDLRTSLSYAGDTRPMHADQDLLAEALAQSGHTEEATNYLLTSWETNPGDGFLNLQLARLSRQKGESGDATNYYRAAIFGSWQGDGIVRRREIRFELAAFLLQQQANDEARNELEIIASNAGSDVGVLTNVAQMLEAAGYPDDAQAIANSIHTRHRTGRR